MKWEHLMMFSTLLLFSKLMNPLKFLGFFLVLLGVGFGILYLRSRSQ